MRTERAREILSSAALDQPGAFYGPEAGLALGAGLLIDQVEFPIFDPAKDRFTAKAGLVYVLSHECDLDPSNVRMLNDMALICPVSSVDEVIRQAEAAGLPEDYMSSFLVSLGKRAVSRAVYFPPYPDLLPIGGVMYLNMITSTSVRRLEAGARICAVTAFALTTIDYAIEQHLRRPKSDELPLQRGTIRQGSTRTIRQPR